MGTTASPHFVIFPFMAQGHTIPLLYLARILRQRRVSVTVFTTPANTTTVRSILQDDTISVSEIPFPENVQGIPPGVENTDKLPSISLHSKFAIATKLMQPKFDEALDKLLVPASCIISDTFLGWTQISAAKRGIPRIGFYGMSAFATTMYATLCIKRPHAKTTSVDETFSIPGFPKLELTRNYFDPPYNELEPKGEMVDFMIEQNILLSQSFGMIINSFDELEAEYSNHWTKFIGPKAWCIGPLCLARPVVKISTKSYTTIPKWIQWLDTKLKEGTPVLYVAFGTQSEVSAQQLHEIAKGIEDSEVNFLWVSRIKQDDVLDKLENRALTANRGIIVKEFVDQMEILRHKSIKGFLTHCGWNSLTESISSGVPVLTLPLMADQQLNSRLVVEETGIGLRFTTVNGSVRGLVEAREVEKKVREVMGSCDINGGELKKRVMKVASDACSALKEGGSSWQNLDQIIQDVSCFPNGLFH